MKIAIIGAGISGLATGHLLKKKGHEVTLYERESEPGGLIRCKKVNGCLYHICGGHVFNSKRSDVLDWFWTLFNREKQFVKADRNSIVFLDKGGKIPYPIENHDYLLDGSLQQGFIKDLLDIHSKASAGVKYDNFEDFLVGRFGITLYGLYFQPYNKKVWRRDLSKVPMSWLEGKLPMPTVEEIIYSNMNHVEEKQFVHSTFWYERSGGSQLIVDTFAEGLNINFNFTGMLTYADDKWTVDGKNYDRVVFTGNIKTLLPMLEGVELTEFEESINQLEYHGTTSVFCEIDPNPYSWIYLPSGDYEAHRIICTGNFAKSNNAPGHMTGTIEFTDYISEQDILDNLRRIPFNPKYITHQYNEFTYPIQDKDTRIMIGNVKKKMSLLGLYMTGRFADWEYYNMDTAIGAAMDMCESIV